MAPPSVPGGRGRGPPPAWVLLDRAPRLADLDPAGTESDAHLMLVLHLVAPPAVSTAFLDSTRFDGDDDDRIRIQGADASGRLLLALPSPRTPGDSHLLVSRPVPDTTGRTAKGMALALPAFTVDEALGLAMSPAAPTGILCNPEAQSGDGFVVAQLRSTPPSAPTVAALLTYSSDGDGNGNGWKVVHVPGEDRWRAFVVDRVVSHDRGVYGDAACLVFVDLRRGLLLFHPRLAAARFVDLPECGGGGDGDGDEAQATVDSSDGRLVYVLFDQVPEGMRIRVWSLSDDDDGLRWIPHPHLTSEPSVWPLRGPPMLGPVDPSTMSRMVFAVPCPRGDGTPACFGIELKPQEMAMGLRRVSPACLHALVCNVAAAPSKTWRESMKRVMRKGKHAGLLALGAVQKGRRYADSLPGTVLFVGSALSLPHTSATFAAAKALKTINDSLTISENVSTWFYKNRPGGGGYTRVVESREEADRAVEEWLTLSKPKSMQIDPAVDLPQQEWDEIRRFVIERGAETLVQHHEYSYVVVGGAPPTPPHPS